MRSLFFALTILFSSFAFSAATRTIDADAIRSSDATKTWTNPSISGAYMISAGILQETPSGSVNGSNVTFTLSQTPAQSATVMVHLDGILLTGGGADYSLSGATITMTTAPAAGQSLRVVYSRF